MDDANTNTNKGIQTVAKQQYQGILTRSTTNDKINQKEITTTIVEKKKLSMLKFDQTEYLQILYPLETTTIHSLNDNDIHSDDDGSESTCCCKFAKILNEIQGDTMLDILDVEGV